jgi:hypothetical protein
MALTWLLAALLGAPGFTEAPEYVRLFTPRGVPAGTYRTYTADRSIEEVTAGLTGKFAMESSIASDAFGQSGGYNRWKLALLYGARRVKVARGPRLEGGHVVEAWTLVSPYPDPALERLNTGTLLIVLKLTN